jgi:hypothetical protein
VKSFGNFKITGWENELMNVDRVDTNTAAGRSAAA